MPRLFAGIGGIELGMHAAGHKTELLCEVMPAAKAVLAEHFPDVPLVSDVREIQGPPEAEVVCAGFSCQDFSQAGRTAGIGGKNSGLVAEVFRLVEDAKLDWLVLENVPFMLQLDRGKAMDYLTRELSARGFTWSPTPVQAPTVYWDTWYQNASPGPYFPCTTASGTVPLFDTNSPDGRNGSYNALPFNLTRGSSYSCKTAGGELSWDAVAKKLTVAGTIFIDGSAYITNGATNSYTGQATLYLSGTLLMKNAKLCASLAAGGSSCDTANWDPNKALLAVVTNGSGGQVSSGDGAQFVSAYFQGAVYAANTVEIDTSSAVDGPICGSSVILGQSVTTSFPMITTVPVGMPSNPTVYAQPDPPILSG